MKIEIEIDENSWDPTDRQTVRNELEGKGIINKICYHRMGPRSKGESE